MNQKPEPDSRQIPKIKEICANKKYYDILYAYFQCISKRNLDLDSTNVKRFFPKKAVNYSELGKVFDLTRQTVSTKFKNLIELGLIKECEENKDFYELVVLENKAASLIQYDVLKIITDTLNEKTVSTYVYLFNLFYANDCKAVQFTLEQVKKNIGICTTTRSNDDIVTNILFVLEKLGLIKYHLTQVKQDSSNFQNIKTIYELDLVKNKF